LIRYGIAGKRGTRVAEECDRLLNNLNKHTNLRKVKGEKEFGRREGIGRRGRRNDRREERGILGERSSYAQQKSRGLSFFCDGVQ
jgi:hypothetical protein